MVAVYGSRVQAGLKSPTESGSTIKWLLIPLICSISVVLLTAAGSNFSYRELFNDPADTFGFSPFLGLISMMGLFGWAAAAGVSFLTYAVIRNDVRVLLRRFFFTAGLFTLFMLVDDAFMLHEHVLPAGFGIRERYIKAAYLLVAGTFGVVFMKVLVGHSLVLLLAAGAFFGSSFFFDNPAVLNALGFFHTDFVLYVMEDGSKFTGIVLWLTWIFRTALQAIGTQSSAAR